MSKYTWEFGDKVFYTASAIGSCTRALVYDRQGMSHEPTPEWLLDKFREGVENEQPILERLYRDKPGWKLYDKGELEARGFEFGVYLPDRDVDYSNQIRVRVPIGQRVIVQGHGDGVAYRWLAGDERYGEGRVVEAKAFGPSYWDKFIRHGLAGFPYYQWQLTILMKGTGLPGLFVVGRKDDDGVVQEIKIEEVDELPVRWVEVIGKVMRVEKFVADGVVPDCELPLMYPCPFFPYHDEVEGPDVDETKLFLLESLASEYDRHGKIAKEHNEKKRDIGKEIQAFFDEEFGPLILGPEQAEDPEAKRAPRSVLTPNLKITDVGYWNEGDIDGTRLAADGIDPAKYRKPGYPTRYPKVTKRTGGKAETDADPFSEIPSK